jgi:cyclopropane fatty-acyl-phospholipid synthase-like methyltransferase
VSAIHTQAMDRDWQQIFEDTYKGPPSSVERRIWQEAFGDDYPRGLDPYSFVSRPELARIADELQVHPGDTLVDVGCGRGGPGLWVAGATEAALIGVDIAENALVAARARATAMGIDAAFRIGSFEATGLDSGAAASVMSVDALLFTPNKVAAAGELRRILRPGGRLVLTSWDYHSQPVGRPPQIDDHRPVLEDAGFRIERYEDTDPGLARERHVMDRLLAAVDELAAEEGTTPDEIRPGVEEMAATLDTMIRRFMVVATAT